MAQDRHLGFAIVGCGMIAGFHVKALAEVPGARVEALVSRSRANAEKLASAHNLSCQISTARNCRSMFM